MEVHIYSVKDKSQAGNIWVKDIVKVIKQPDQGRNSTTKEQKWSSFQTNYDN